MLATDQIPRERIEVPCALLSEVFREDGVPFYLKIDIEGYDQHALRAIDPADAPRYVSFEVTRIQDVFLLKERGSCAFKCVLQDTLQQLPCPSPAAVSPGALARAWAREQFRTRPVLRSVGRGLRRAGQAASAWRSARTNGTAQAAPAGRRVSDWRQWARRTAHGRRWNRCATPGSRHFEPGRGGSIWADVHATRRDG